MTALANGRGTIEERLARWLLLANDRIDEEELPLTQEFLSLMLGVTRPGVTMAVQSFERRRLIAKKRGSIVILNRAGLEKLAGATYTPAVFFAGGSLLDSSCQPVEQSKYIIHCVSHLQRIFLQLNIGDLAQVVTQLAK